MFLTSTAETKVMNSFLNLNNNKRINSDGRIIERIKFIMDLICFILTHTSNLVLQYGVLVRNMEIVEVIDLNVGGDMYNLSNFGTISIYQCFLKD